MPVFIHGILTVALAAIVVGLSGCSSSSVTFSDLEKTSSSRHPVPAALPAYAFQDVQAKSIRWVGAQDGTELWLGKGRTGSTVCLLVYPNDEKWTVGCGGTTGVNLSTGADGTTFAVVPDGINAPSGYVAVSDNVFTPA